MTQCSSSSVSCGLLCWGQEVTYSGCYGQRPSVYSLPLLTLSSSERSVCSQCCNLYSWQFESKSQLFWPLSVLWGTQSSYRRGLRKTSSKRSNCSSENNNGFSPFLNGEDVFTLLQAWFTNWLSRCVLWLADLTGWRQPVRDDDRQMGLFNHLPSIF